MENTVESVVTSVVSSGVVSSAAVWFLRSFISDQLRASIQHEYNQKLEAFKAYQESIRSQEVERLRSELHIVATEREIQFRGLQERRAEVVAGIYAGLQRANSVLQVYASDIRFQHSTDEELLDRLSEHFDAINEHFHPSAIYLPRELADRIRQVLDRIQRLVRDVQKERRPNAQWTEQAFVRLHDRIDAVLEELPIRMDEVEKEFRRLLGDNGSEVSQSDIDDRQRT